MVVLRILVRCSALLLFLSLASCGPDKASENSQDPFIAALHQSHEDGQTYEEIADRILFREFPGQEIEVNYDFDETSEDGAAGSENEQSTEEPKIETADQWRLARILKFSALRDRDCAKLWRLLGDRNKFLESKDLMAAVMLDEGICLDPDPHRAAEIYRERAEQPVPDAVALARLGSLYLEGKGVEADPDHAERLFGKAAIDIAQYYWSTKQMAVEVEGARDDKTADRIQNPEDAEKVVWGMSSSALYMRFADISTGPWELPAPLAAKIAWLDALYADGGQEIKELAKDMMYGRGGYEMNIFEAVSWMRAAGHFPASDEADYLSALWELDPSVCKLFRQQVPQYTCDFSDDLAFEQMEKLALRGYPEAVDYVSDCYHRSASDWRGAWAQYQYVIAGSSDGNYVPFEEIADARSKLDEFEQGIVGAWVRRQPDKPIFRYLPGSKEVLSKYCLSAGNAG